MRSAFSLVEYAVNVTRVEGTMIGLRLLADSGGLKVTRVSTEGLIAEWNSKNPSQQIHEDDHVIEVNGIREDGHMMLQECLLSPSLQMIIRCTGDIEQRLRTMQYDNLSYEDFEFLCWLDDAMPPTTGVHRAFVAQLPRTVGFSRSETDMCSICFNESDIDVGVTELPCKHRFCTKCIMAWLTVCNDKCPLCKAAVHCPGAARPSSFDDTIGCHVVAETDHVCSALVQDHVLMPRMRSISSE